MLGDTQYFTKNKQNILFFLNQVFLRKEETPEAVKHDSGFYFNKKVWKFLFWLLSELRNFSLSGPSAAQTASACVLSHIRRFSHKHTQTHTLSR